MENEKTIIKEFEDDLDMFMWLLWKKNLDDLKQQYPPDMYCVEMDPKNRRVQVRKTNVVLTTNTTPQ